MPKRVTRDWFSRAAVGLTSGALALSLLSTGGGSVPITGVRAALAEEIDCYNDQDLYDLPECVERRELDRQNGNAPNEAQGAPGGIPEEGSAGQPISGAGDPQPPGGGDGQQANGDGDGQPTGDGGDGQQASGGEQQAAASDGDSEDDKPASRPAVTDPKQVVLTLADAGKEATQYLNDEGTDKYGKFARTRFERERTTAASTLGPNVMDSKVWVANDVEAAKALFKDQAAIKSFPERTEGVEGPVEKIEPTSFGEEFSFTAGYIQDEKIWHHYRFVMRVGNVVSVVYLFGRDEFFEDTDDRTWNGQGDWFTGAVFRRM